MTNEEAIQIETKAALINAMEQLAHAERLAKKSSALVDLLDDAERNHGSLVGTKTLRARDELRLELARWK